MDDADPGLSHVTLGGGTRDRPEESEYAHTQVYGEYLSQVWCRIQRRLAKVG